VAAKFARVVCARKRRGLRWFARGRGEAPVGGGSFERERQGNPSRPCDSGDRNSVLPRGWPADEAGCAVTK
jgi:hypothetical protein